MAAAAAILDKMKKAYLSNGLTIVTKFGMMAQKETRIGLPLVVNKLNFKNSKSRPADM